MEVNNGKESDSMEKIEKQKWGIYYEGKSTLKCFGFSKPSSGLLDGEININRKTMDVLKYP